MDNSVPSRGVLPARRMRTHGSELVDPCTPRSSFGALPTCLHVGFAIIGFPGSQFWLPMARKEQVQGFGDHVLHAPALLGG